MPEVLESVLLKTITSIENMEAHISTYSGVEMLNRMLLIAGDKQNYSEMMEELYKNS